MVMRGKVGNSQHFPTNLHILLDEAEKQGHGHIVSWCAQGQSFKIHDQEALVPLLAKYFRQTKFKSFLRQLQSYGFHRTTRGVDKGVVSHPYFARGRRSLCFRMTRKPSGAAAAEAMTRQIVNKSGHNRVLPGNAIIPLRDNALRKTQSAPLDFHSHSANFQAGAYANVADMKNATFASAPGAPMGEIGPNFLLQKNGFRADHVPSLLKPTRMRSQSTTALASHASSINHKLRRSSDPVVLLSSAQRQSLQECAQVDYRTSQPERRSPNNGFLLSIQETTSIPIQVASSQSQQVNFKNHQQQMPLQPLQKPLQHQGHMYQQVIQVQQAQNTNQVHIQQMHSYQPAHASQHQVSVRYSAQQDQQQFPQHQLSCTHYEVKPQQQAKPQESSKLYSEQEVAQQIKLAEADMQKNFQQQLHKQQGNNSRQNQPMVHEEKSCMEQQFQVPLSAKSSDKCATSPVTSSLPHPHKTSTMLASNKFELSFSTSEFSNTMGNQGANAPYNTATFSVPSLGGATANASKMGMVMPPTPRAAMNAYKNNSVELKPIEIHNMQSTHHSLQGLDLNQQANDQSIEPAPADTEDNHWESTMETLFQSGHEDFGLHPDDVADGLDYFVNHNAQDVSAAPEVESSCMESLANIQHNHHSNPVPAFGHQFERRQ